MPFTEFSQLSGQFGGFFREPAATPMARSLSDPAMGLISGQYPTATMATWLGAEVVGGGWMWRRGMAGTQMTRAGAQMIGVLPPNFHLASGPGGAAWGSASGASGWQGGVQRQLNAATAAARAPGKMGVSARLWRATKAVGGWFVPGRGVNKLARSEAMAVSLGQGSNRATMNAMNQIVRASGARLGTATADRALVRAGFSGNQVTRWNQGRAIKGFGRFVGWAELGFLAFQGIGSLVSSPKPVKAPPLMRTTSLRGTFTDTGVAYTQRRRALEMIHNTQYTGRSGLGNEASIIHS